MNIEEIHDYLDNRMSSKDKEDFVQKMNNDRELRDEVMLQSKMMEHAGASEDINIGLDMIADVHKQYEAVPVIEKQTPWKLIGLMIIGIIGLLYILSTQLKQEPSTPPQLYAEYFSPPPASFNTKGSDAIITLQKAEVAYNKKEYQQAIELFESYKSSSDTKNDEVSFHIALSHMALGNYEEAKKEIIELKSSNNLFAKDCDWYLSLIYLKEGDMEKAIGLLKTFTSGSYKEKASSIIQQLQTPN